ncbi:MAG: hypothetical protein ABSF20_00310 [Smithella sp.]
MVTPSDYLPALIRYGDIVYEYLRKHLTDDQISSYLDLINTPNMTLRIALEIITKKHGHPEIVFYSLESLARINALCNTAECPSEEPIAAERAFLVTFSALQTGLMIGAIADDKGKEEIFALAKHGKKFAESVGRKPDKFTKLLESIVIDYYQQNGSFPNYMKVFRILKQRQGNGLIHTVDDDDGTIEWGEKGNTSLPTLKNRLSIIRKKIKK